MGILLCLAGGLAKDLKAVFLDKNDPIYKNGIVLEEEAIRILVFTQDVGMEVSYDCI